MPALVKWVYYVSSCNLKRRWTHS